jgi:1-aminocyclopropane-1-carboxylate deaminase
VLNVPTPIEAVKLQSFDDLGIELHVKRDDLIHPHIIGNKLRKSLPHFELCKQLGHTSVLTFGGRFSNHLLAIAQAGQLFNIATTGVVRGTDLSGASAVLDQCRRMGMRIIPVENEDYYPLQQISINELVARLALDKLSYIIPEGGTSVLALEGVGQIINEIADIQSYNYIICAVGTGGTVAGLAWALAQRTEQLLPKVLAIAVLKGYATLPEQGLSALQEKVGVATAEQILVRHLEFDGSAPYGRYGKPVEAVMRQLQELQGQLAFPIDYVYTGKVLLQLQHLAGAERFNRGSKLLFLHTGGYQTAAIHTK